jgi:two-component system OmpR family response regulator
LLKEISNGVEAHMRILVVEDEIEIARLLVDRLRSGGYEVDHAPTIGAARRAVDSQSYALAVLDRRLPDGDSLGLILDIRKRHPGARIVVLSALEAVTDRIAGLDAGADDYLVKPFDVDELLARVRANLRRGVAGRPPIAVGALTFDPTAREAFIEGKPLLLHRRELALLEALAIREGQVAAREALLDEVYTGEEESHRSNALDALASRLRKRLAEAGARVDIQSIRGRGYLLTATKS